MPETLAPVGELVDRLEENEVRVITLLVVPGRRWGEGDIARLEDWSRRGHELAGHGWTHEVERIATLGHRLHSLLISRRAAEHLSQPAADLERLVARNHAWFGEHGLPAPRLYVPPAWALGDLDPAVLRRVGFRYLETLLGFHDLASGTVRRLPTLGFEADTALRQVALGLSNRWARLHRFSRLAIHPHDLSLRLGRSLARVIADLPQPIRLEELFAGT